GKAATLANMAGVIAQQGDVGRALQLWQQSLEILEKIGNVRGKAATLANMAWAAGEQGDTERQFQLNLDAARSLARVYAWLDLVTVLGNLGTRGKGDAIRYLAQAMWLLVRVTGPVEDSVKIAAILLEKVGMKSPAAPTLAAGAVFMAATRGESDPKHEEMQRLALGMLAACAAARQVPEDQLKEWIEKEGLLDPGQWRPKLDAALEEMAGGEEYWLFDRALFHQK
ncbi:MAG: tetratricopeptide repeat protein, partial [Planctomycetes bacterium]|nr:tetratricopeptide repeat protein [Planctomycetota bacterium]